MTTLTELQRDHAIGLCKVLNQYAINAPYVELRPMQTRYLTEPELIERLKNGTMPGFDCSESCTLVPRLSGWKDPNGLRFDGYGWTGTMLSHLPHFTDWNEVHKGTLIVFGSYPGTHVVMCIEPNGDNPLVYSHGSHAAHAIWDMNTERQYHTGEPITLLAVEGL